MKLLTGPWRRRANKNIDQTAVLTETARLSGADITIGANSHIRGELLLFPGGKISIGEYCYVGEQSRIWSAASITIGAHVLISHLCTIMDNLTHPINAEERRDQFRAIIERGHPTDVDLDPRPVVIEDDVLIGCNVVVLRGVHIGCRAIIGAGSVVTKDIPECVLVGGNPATVIRELTSAERSSNRFHR